MLASCVELNLSVVVNQESVLAQIDSSLLQGQDAELLQHLVVCRFPLVCFAQFHYLSG